MGWPSTLTYQEVVATGIARSIGILANYGDVGTAASLFSASPALADDPDALAAAAEGGHEAFVRLMLGYQPDLARRVAVVARTRELTEFLFRSGMNPNLPNWLRITPLHRFAGQGDVEKAAIFIDHGADLHARDDELSSTPLAYAARQGQLRMVEFLLRRGAKPNLPEDPAWATPLAWATRRGHEEIARLLTEFEKSGTLPARTLEHYEALARDLVEAYGGDDDDAFLRVMDHFRVRRPLTWDRPSQAVRVARLRVLVRGRLGPLLDEQPDGKTLALKDAQLLIARSEGFESWPQLMNTSWTPRETV